MKKMKLEGATSPDEAPAPTKLSADHLRQVELASMDIRIHEGLVKIAEERLKTKRMAQRVIELEAQVSSYELTAATQAFDEAKKRHRTLLSDLKAPYQLTDRWSYHPDTGDITREG